MKSERASSAEDAGALVYPESASPPGSTPPHVPDHDLLRCIGCGSYGEVWLARSILGEFRAVKVIHRRAIGDNRPFDREFEGIQHYEPISRSHESQVQILHVGRHDDAGYFYYVMELADDACGVSERVGEPVSGKVGECVSEKAQPASFRSLNPATYMPKTLASQVRTPTHSLTGSPTHALTGSPTHSARLPIAQCLEIGLALTTALEHLHGRGLVHRDIKPSNIIFVRGRPKLADIGLVTDAGDAASIVGTEGYLAPEGPGSPQADLYSLGKVLYEISTGRDRRHFPDLPLDFSVAAGVPPAVEPGVPPGGSGVGSEKPFENSRPGPGGRMPPSTAGGTPAATSTAAARTGLLELNEIVLKACARDTRQRYQTAAEMRGDLELLQRGQSIQRRRLGERRWGFARKIGFSLAAVAALAVGAWVLSTRLVWRNPNPLRAKADVKRPPSPEVIRLCKLGEEAEAKGTRESLIEAFELLNRAIALDPGYVPAYLHLASAYHASPDWLLPARQAMPEVKRAAINALQIDPSSVGALQWLALFKMEFEWDWAGAEADFKRAIQLNPNEAFFHFFYAGLLLNRERPQEARIELERALELAPNHPTTINGMVSLYCAERRFDDALALALKGRREHPNTLAFHGWLAWIYEHKGMYLQAIDELRAARAIDDGPDFMGFLGYMHAASGAKVRARELLNQMLALSSHRHVPPYYIALVHVGLGDTDAAILCLQKAVLEKSLSLLGAPGLLGIGLDPHFDPLRSDPRFEQLLRDMHLRLNQFPSQAR